MLARLVMGSAALLLAAAFVLLLAFDRRAPAGADDPVPSARRTAPAGPAPNAARSTAVLTGRVVGPDGQPVPGAHLALSSADGARSTHTPLRTGSDGSFRIPGLEAGSWRLAVWPELRGERGARSLGSRVVEGVAAGGAELLVTLPWARSTRGRVLGASGEPVARAYVTARTASGHAAASVLTDATGAFELWIAEDELHELDARPPAVPGPERAVATGAELPTARLAGVRAGAEDLELRLPE